jgi:hypothetical protein
MLASTSYQQQPRAVQRGHDVPVRMSCSPLVSIMSTNFGKKVDRLLRPPLRTQLSERLQVVKVRHRARLRCRSDAMALIVKTYSHDRCCIAGENLKMWSCAVVESSRLTLFLKNSAHSDEMPCIDVRQMFFDLFVVQSINARMALYIEVLLHSWTSLLPASPSSLTSDCAFTNAGS